MQKISCIKSFGSITGEHLFLKEIDAFFHLKNTLSFVFVHSCCFLQQSNLNLSISASCWEKYRVFQKLFWPFFCFTCSNWTDRKVLILEESLSSMFNNVLKQQKTFKNAPSGQIRQSQRGYRLYCISFAKIYVTRNHTPRPEHLQ